jgi:PmbA protein
MNSHGLVAKDNGTFFEASLTATAKGGAKSSEGSESTAGRSLKELRPKDIGKKAAEMAIKGLKAKPLKEGTYDIILAPEPVVNIIGYIGYLTSPVIARLYFPLFLDKHGKQVGSKQLTFIDDPLMAGGVGSSPIDEEGAASKKITIMEKGVLKNFVYDSFSGAMEKKRTTSSGVRASFAAGVSAFPGKNYNSEPVPIPRNLYIEPGNWKRDEIIKDTKDGLLAQRFHYTRLTNPTRGDFTSVLRMGLYKIEKGEVVGTIQKSRLIDNLLNILKNVNAVSDRLVVAGSWGGYAHTPVIRTKAHMASV